MSPASKNLPAKREVSVTLESGPGGSYLPAAAILEAVRKGAKLRLNLDDADIAAAILKRKLDATTVEELDVSGELDDIAPILGKPVKVIGMGLRNSDDKFADNEGGLGVYVILNVVTLEGEMLTVGSGATDVVVTSNKVVELDRLGKDWWIIAPSAKETAGGFRPINMTLTKVAADAEGKPF